MRPPFEAFPERHEVSIVGAFSGSISYKLFFVQGDLPPKWKEQFLERIALRKFVDLSPEDEDEESYGWVQIQRPLETEFPLAHVVYNDYLNLGFRRDKYSISTDLFKAKFGSISREFLKQNEQEKLTRLQKEDLQRMVRNDLKRQTLPSMKVTDMSWNVSDGMVRLWSQSAKFCELFQGYFEDTFGMKLLPAGPYITAVQLGLEPEQVELLTAAEPTNFVSGTVGVGG